MPQSGPNQMTLYKMSINTTVATDRSRHTQKPQTQQSLEPVNAPAAGGAWFSRVLAQLLTLTQDAGDTGEEETHFQIFQLT